MKNRWVIPAFIFILPFLLFHWMLPFFSGIIPGRDFVQYYVWLQMELMAALKAGTFPLFLHTDFNGLPSNIATAYSHIYLPFPYIAAILPGYWTGQAVDWNLLLFLMMIPIAHWVLFVFAREAGLTAGTSFFLTSLTVYSPRILPDFFYGAGIATWTGHILLCACVGLYYIKPTKWSPVAIIAATYLLVNSGQPEEMFYGFLNAILLTLTIPYLLATIMADKKNGLAETLRFWSKTGACCLIGFALSSANLIPSYIETFRNISFSHQDYEWASRSTITITSLISNFFSPLRASPMCCFGSTPTYLMILLLPLLKILHFQIPKIIWIIVGIIFFSILHMLGELTPVHYFFWKYFPLASSIRYPARISFLLPMQFLMASLWLFQTSQTAHINISQKKINVAPLTFLAVISIVLFLAYPLSELSNPDKLFFLPALNLTVIPPWVEPLILVNGITILAILTAGSYFPKMGKTGELLIYILICLHLSLLLKYCPSMTEQKNPDDMKTYNEFIVEKTETIRTFPKHIFITENFLSTDAVKQANKYFLPPGIGKIYRKATYAKDRDHAYLLLNSNRRQDELILEKQHPELTASDCFKEKKTCIEQQDSLRLIYSSYNRLTYQVTTCQKAFLSVPVPYTPQHHWRAYINKKRTDVFRANGFECAVLIPKGDSIVEFKYWSDAAAWGMGISCICLACLGVWVGSSKIKNKTAGCMIAVVAPVIAAGLFFLWYNSLYSGKNFNTKYEWASPSSNRPDNLAFGKMTSMSSCNRRDPFTHLSRRGVDGDHSLASCFITEHQRSPWWEVDLEIPILINRINIYTSVQGYESGTMIPYHADTIQLEIFNNRLLVKERPALFNLTPLRIAVSNDHNSWEVAEMKQLKKDMANYIQFAEPKTIRYIKILASGECRLCLNEIEIYAPEETPMTSSSEYIKHSPQRK